MPPHIQPRSLQDLTIVKVAGMVFHSCVAIEEGGGQLEWSASQQKEVSDLQQFLLAKLWHLFDEVCEAMGSIHVFKRNREGKWKYLHSSCDILGDFRIFSSLLIHEEMRVLRLGRSESFNFMNKVFLDENQIVKLKNIVELDIDKTTDKVLEGIGNTCRHLRKVCISSDSKHSILGSLCNLLKCRELECVEIFFDGWREDQYNPYIIQLLTQLPKIQVFNNFSTKSTAYLSMLTSVTSLQQLDIVVNNERELTNIFQMCPDVRHLVLSNIRFKVEQNLLVILAESSLIIQTLELTWVTFHTKMTLLLEHKGDNLTKLSLSGRRETTLDYIYTIGINCPKLGELRMEESKDDTDIDDKLVPTDRSKPVTPRTSIVTTPNMFRNLRSLYLVTRTLCDLRLLLQTLLYANSLTSLTVLAYGGVYTHGFLDIVSEVLNTNCLAKVEYLQLHINKKREYPTPLTSRAAIEHLVESCPKLTNLELSLPLDEDAVSYIEELKIKIKKENFNLKLCVKDSVYCE